jgi:hypothetical protein
MWIKLNAFALTSDWLFPIQVPFLPLIEIYSRCPFFLCHLTNLDAPFFNQSLLRKSQPRVNTIPGTLPQSKKKGSHHQ